MANRLARYNAALVAITAGGVNIQGYADGSFCEIEDITEAWNEVCGTDGEVGRGANNDRRLKVLIKLLQTSISNAVLTQLFNTDRNTPNGAPFSCQVEETSGGSLAVGAEAWIMKIPNAEYDRGVKVREWEIHIAVGNREENGNA